jgi:hypothetical protein
MPPTTRQFVPTWRNALVESAFVALIAPAFVVAVFVLTRGIESLPFALLFGAVFGTGQFGYYGYRFYRRAPRRVVLDDRGLELHGPGEGARSFPWARVERAVHRSKGGLHWTFDLKADDFQSRPETLVLLDDGFNTEQWDQLTKAIHVQLDAHRVQKDSEELATAFDDEP